MSKNQLDRLLTDARTARDAIAKSPNCHDSALVRAMVALENQIDSLKRIRAGI
jgi:hypothetical protein